MRVLRWFTPLCVIALLVFAMPAAAEEVPQPTEPAPPTGTVRASMTWDQPVDIDLHIHDAEGNHAWYGEMHGIPEAFLTHDNVDGFGPGSLDDQSEDFVDERSPSDRPLAYRACYFSAATLVAPTTHVTLVVRDPGSDTPRTLTATLRDVNDCVDLTRSPDAPLADPVARITTETGSVNVDPFSGEVSVLMPRGEPSDVTIQRMVRCPDDAVGGANVQFLLNGVPIGGPPASADPQRAGSWQAVIPAADIGEGTTLITARFECDGVPQDVPVGEIVLIDPSGNVTDAVTGAPIEGATVTLHRMPATWTPRADGEDVQPSRCDSPESRIGATPWSQAVPEGGFEHDPLDPAALIAPLRNPIQTTATGRYAWDVQGGSCWYVTVEKAGYQTATSALVGVNVGGQPVLDLHVQLQPIPAPPAGTTGGGTTQPGTKANPTTAGPVEDATTRTRSTIRPRVTIAAARAATRRSARRIAVSGRITPVACGARGQVALEQQVGGKWRTYGLARASRTGTFRIHTVPRARGALRVTFAGATSATASCVSTSSRTVAPPR